jgi:HD-like signal output (HDOD) protein
MLQTDPAMAARILQVANSPMYRVNHKVDDCRTAVARLGMITTRNLITSFALKRAFNVSSPVLKEIFRKAWQQSSEVAAISFVLSRVTPGMHPDKGMLAGLIHNIGMLPILRYAAEYPEIRKNRELLMAIMKKIGAKLGTMVLRGWSFDDELVEVPGHVGNWEYAPDKPLNYADIVIVAHVHSQFGTDKKYEGPPLSEVESFRKMPLFQMGPDASIELLYEAREEIDMLMSMLSSG